MSSAMPGPHAQAASEAAQLSASQSAWYRCRHCSDSFKREDHLRRHELSHGFPRFLCDHNGCGMRFHRKDVLQRHKLVHQPNPLKRRRKPRRGPIPHGPIQQAGGQASWSGEDSAEGSTTSPDASHPPLHQSDSLTQDILTNLPGVQVSNGHGTDARLQVDPLSAQSFDTFNLTNEFTYGLEDWSEYALPFDGYNVRSWQDYAMPTFETPVTADVLPFFALAHAPNADFVPPAMPSPLNLPLNSQDMLRCVNSFRRGVLPRHPFLHHVTCEEECMSQNSPLFYAMAMAGAMELDQYRSKAEKLFKIAVQELDKGPKTVISQLRNVQARTLLIDFGVWYGDESMRKWARRERTCLAQTRMDFLQAHFLPLNYDNWLSWRRREEVKRTAFAFCVCGTTQTFLYDEELNIVADKLEITLPCPDSVWEATTEDDWRREVANLSLHEKAEINFPAAAHAMLSCDTVHVTDYELATVFGQQILLAVICDTFNTAHRLRNNYTSVAAWEARDMAAFRLRESLDGALTLWGDLWWTPVETLWELDKPTLPKGEAQVLYHYARMRFNRNREFAQTRPPWTYKAVESAVQTFSSMSKIGFTEVATHAPTLFSVSAYYMCTEVARHLMTYMTAIASPVYAPLTPRDTEIVTRIRQAVRRHTTSAPFIRFSSTLGAVPRPGSCIGHIGSALGGSIPPTSRSINGGGSISGNSGGCSRGARGPGGGRGSVDAAVTTTSPTTTTPNSNSNTVHAAATPLPPPPPPPTATPILPSNTNTSTNASATTNTTTTTITSTTSTSPTLASASASTKPSLAPAVQPPHPHPHHHPNHHQQTLTRPRAPSQTTPTLASAVAASAASSASSLATLARQLEQLWTIAFGGDEWKSARSVGGLLKTRGKIGQGQGQRGSVGQRQELRGSVGGDGQGHGQSQNASTALAAAAAVAVAADLGLEGGH